MLMQINILMRFVELARYLNCDNSLQDNNEKKDNKKDKKDEKKEDKDKEKEAEKETSPDLSSQQGNKCLLHMHKEFLNEICLHRHCHKNSQFHLFQR